MNTLKQNPPEFSNWDRVCYMRMALVIFATICLQETVHALPHFFSAKFDDGTEVDSSEIGTRTPLILIHGIQSDPSIWNNFLNYWKASAELSNNFKPYVFGYYTQEFLIRADDPTTVLGLSQRLGSYLQQWYNSPTRSPIFGFHDKRVVILAHSMGGLVARSMMQNFYFADGTRGGEKVLLLITLATPHHGSPLANKLFTLEESAWKDFIIDQLFDLHRDFLGDLAWDCFDGISFYGFCGDWLAKQNNNDTFSNHSHPTVIREKWLS